jgi:DNA-binding Lrp family transcriptional regulator
LISAYVLAKVEAGKERETLEKIKTVDGVDKAKTTFGTWDLVIEVSFESIGELDKFVFHNLRIIPQVKESMTVICSEEMSKEN